MVLVTSISEVKVSFSLQSSSEGSTINLAPLISMKALPMSFYKRPAEVVGPDLIGCLLVKRQLSGDLLWGVIVETEAYSQDEPACHGYHRRSPQNETLFGEPGHFYVYISYGIHHCVNVVTYQSNWANGVLLRAIALPNENERIAAGPALLARRFQVDRSYDNSAITIENDLWLAEKSTAIDMEKIICTTRIGISKAKDLPWRWYLQSSRSVSKRTKNDRSPSIHDAWVPNSKGEK